MTPEDWIMIVFLAGTLVLSFVCRWQRQRDDREWADFHAPLTTEDAGTWMDVALGEAKTATALCSGCGFQDFSTKTVCAMCGKALVVSRTGNMVSKDPSSRTRLTSDWIRKLDVDGKLYWYLSASTNERKAWPRVVVHFKSEAPRMPPLPVEASVQGITSALWRELETTTLQLEPSTVDPSINFSAMWHLSAVTNTNQAREFVASIRQPFPERVAKLVTCLSHRVSSLENKRKIVSLSFRREFVLTESLEALATLPLPHTRAPIRVSFIGVPAIDAGGVYREWFSLVGSKIASPEATIFTCVDQVNRTFYLNQHSKDLAIYFAAGRFFGRALLDGNLLSFHLAPPLLKLILGHPIGFPDLELFDPELYKHLSWLANTDDVESLGLDFTVCERLPTGKTHVVDLLPQGSNVTVTDANKFEYIDRLTKHRLIESISDQLYAFLKGLYDVVPPELLALFSMDELDYLLCGSDEIDIDDWEHHTRYTQDVWHHPTRQWFWEIVREMPVALKRRLLQFATGSSRPPLVGFSALTSYDGRLAPFTLVGRPLADEGFVRSHACFNRLDVPLYVNKNHLKRGLYMLLETDQFGFSMV